MVNSSINKKKKKRFPLHLKIYINIFIIIAIFFLGLSFGKWGGFDRIMPEIINFLRDRVFGDKFVLNAEKSLFSAKDFLKKNTVTILENDSTADVKQYSLNAEVKNFVTSYINDYSKYNPKDYETLVSFFNNFSPDLKPVYQSPLKDEGHWEKLCISETTYRPLFAKTFLRTDIKRPYSKVYIYKFDLDRVKIEFIIGKDDTDRKALDGKMTAAQKEKVLWIFNGGFQYKHGNYGYKYNGEIIKPPKSGIATLLFYKNGTYKIVEWNDEYLNDENIISFRQNEIPLIISKKPNYDAQKYWGLTPKNVDPIYTFRSGIGLTENNELIFAAGAAISPETLALGLISAGASDAMHLDMNYWNVHMIGVKRDEKGNIITYNECPVLCYYNDMYVNYGKRDYFIISGRE